MAAGVQVQKGDRLRTCTICGLLIAPGQWQVHDPKGVYHHFCWSHGSPQAIEVEEE